MVALNVDAARGTPPSVVANTVLDIFSERSTSIRTLCGQDAGLFIGLRSRMTDEAWIAMSDTLDDGGLFKRFGAAVGEGLCPNSRCGKLAHHTKQSSGIATDEPQARRLRTTIASARSAS